MKRASLWTGVVLVGIVLVAGLVSLVWTPFDPNRVFPGAALQGPQGAHILGFDQLGRDLFSRVLAGSQICLIVGVISVSIAALIGVPWGIAAGMLKGWPSELLMRVADILYAFPALLLAILFAAARGSSTWSAMTAIGIATIPAFARVARAATLSVMSSDYILAARASGTPYLMSAVRHVLPNIAPVLGVQASVSFGMAILAEAALSYLGLGSPPLVVTWGRMLREAQTYMFNDPALALWPGLAIAGAVLGFNLLGDGLRDLLDPRLREAV